jgi:predicted DNA-binding protein
MRRTEKKLVAMRLGKTTRTILKKLSRRTNKTKTAITEEAVAFYDNSLGRTA